MGVRIGAVLVAEVPGPGAVDLEPQLFVEPQGRRVAGDDLQLRLLVAALLGDFQQLSEHQRPQALPAELLVQRDADIASTVTDIAAFLRSNTNVIPRFKEALSKYLCDHPDHTVRYQLLLHL